MNSDGRTVLYIDADASSRRLVSTGLTECGYIVVAPDDPSTALGELQNSHCRVAIVDIDMPGIDGLEILQQIKHHDGGIQVIVLIGLVSMSTVLRAMRWGAEDCLFKPIEDVEPLCKSVDAAFEKVDRWWDTLQQLKQRKKRAAGEAATRDGKTETHGNGVGAK